MYDAYSKGISYSRAFWILMGLWLAGFIVGGIVSIPIWILMTGKGLSSMQQEMLNPENVNAVRVIQVVSTALTFFLPAFITAFLINRRPGKILGLTMRFEYRQLLMVIAIMLAAAVVAASLATFTEWIPISKSATAYFKEMEENYVSQVEVMANMNAFGDYLISMVMIALLPAFFEETFFRGGMQNFLTRILRKPGAAILITSIIFSLVHISYYGFLARLCLGVVLGLIFYYAKSLWLSIIAHFFNNAIAVTQMYVLMKRGKSVREAMNDNYPIWWGMIATLVLYGLFIIFKKYSAKAVKEFTEPEDRALEERWIA